MSLHYKSDSEQTPAEIEAKCEVDIRKIPVTPHYVITLITCIATVHLLQTIIYFMHIGSGLEYSFYSHGFNVVLFAQGQYWRILTGIVLHSGVVHVFFNSLGLFVLGKLFEFLSNRAHLAIVFLLSGIGGGLLTFLFVPYSNSIGASGAILGLLGYLTVYGYKRRRLLPNSFLRNILFGIGFMVFIGIVVPRVDNFGHLGGFLTGAMYGLIQVPSNLYKDPSEAGKTTNLMGTVTLWVIILTSLFSILLVFEMIRL